MMLICLHLLLLSVIDGLPLAKIPMMDLHHLFISPEDGFPLAKTFNHNMLNQIVASKDDHKILLSIVANADPAKLHEIISLIRVLLVASENELNGLTTESENADVAYNSAVNANNAAIIAQTNGLTQLTTDYGVAEAAAQTIYDQGVNSLQAVVDASKIAKDTASDAKNTANGVLSAERSRLESEISSLEQVIALLEGVIGINTVAPTVDPTFGAIVAPTQGTFLPTQGCFTVNGFLLASRTQLFYNGFLYRTLQPAVIDGKSKSNRIEQSWFSVPEGYEVVPDSNDIGTNVIAPHYWDIWRVCTMSKCYAGKHYKELDNYCSSGQMCVKDNKQMWAVDISGRYRIKPSSPNYYRLLIRIPCSG